MTFGFSNEKKKIIYEKKKQIKKTFSFDNGQKKITYFSKDWLNPYCFVFFLSFY